MTETVATVVASGSALVSVANLALLLRLSFRAGEWKGEVSTDLRHLTGRMDRVEKKLDTLNGALKR